MVDKQDIRLQAMQAGREAGLVASVVRPYIDSRLEILVSRMASAYRSQKADYPTLLGIAAQVTFCLDMLSDLESRMRKGSAAAEEEIGASKSN
jgi:hypothetical protein